MTGEKRAKDASSRPETLPSAPDTVASSPSLADALGATQALTSSPLGNPRHAAAPPSDSDGGSASRVAVEGSDLLTPGDSEQTDTLVATRIKQSLAPRTLPSAGAEPPAEANAKSPDRFQRRYAKRRTLGAGGMGEVILFRGQTIGRDVARKVIRDGNLHSEARMRFLREARVQGQLEHPAIVPVYDLGVDPSGNLYFAMKRLRGLSLDEVLDELRDADSDVPSARGTSFKER